MTTIRELFETNMFGTMALTQAVLPQFRQRRAGVVVNVTSSVTLKSIPLIASYTATKAAVNAFTESMAIELAPFGVRARSWCCRDARRRPASATPRAPACRASTTTPMPNSSRAPSHA
jgi:short-subunit dehydrogenase